MLSRTSQMESNSTWQHSYWDLKNKKVKVIETEIRKVVFRVILWRKQGKDDKKI